MAIARDSLLSLEQYAKQRKTLREAIIAHKKLRAVRLGNHLSLLFEDEQTIRYQIQEMLHIERIFEEDGIQAELDAYLPLVPDGTNLKATLQIEYEHERERREALRRLLGIEDRLFVAVDGEAPVYAIADEDLERETDEKTSAVHFLRFELPLSMRTRLRAGAALALGCDHRHYRIAAHLIETPVRDALVADLRA
jgi:hypothetical protein